MGRFRTAAVIAAKTTRDRKINPIEAWVEAVKDAGLSSSSQKKGCPKNTFLGLCEDGLIIGVKPGEYTKSKKNKAYGVNAVTLLRKNPELANKQNELWRKACGDPVKSHNSQMDVVVALWNAGLIKKDLQKEIYRP